MNEIELIKKGQTLSQKYNNDYERYVYSDEFNENPSAYEQNFISTGFGNPNFEFEIKTFYRIGCPIKDEYGEYISSYNFAEQRSEAGVSVVTVEWLHSLKSIFFGTSDDDLKRKGVYEIEGIELPYKGGDDEPLILVVGEPVKTRIRTRQGLEKAVKNINKYI